MSEDFLAAPDYFRGINVHVKCTPSFSSRIICLAYNSDRQLDLRFFIKHSDPLPSSSSTIQCTGALLSVELDDTFPQGYVQVNSSPYFGLLGCLQIDRLAYILLISRATPIAVTLGDPMYQINHVEAISLTDAKYDLFSPVPWASSISEASVEKSASCIDILKVLSDGTFYFSLSSNLSLLTQKRLAPYPPSPVFPDCLSHFCWNEYLIEPFISFFKSNSSAEPRLTEAFSSPPFRIHIIRGYVGQFFLTGEESAEEMPDNVEELSMKKYSLNSLVKSSISSALRMASTRLGLGASGTSGSKYSKNATLPSLTISFDETSTLDSSNSFLLISRVGSKRAGTRFLTRGVDDDGNTANFVETEMILETDGKLFSFASVRGSVPVFWEQQGFQIGNHKIQFTRSLDASDLSFREHFSDLLHMYSSPVYVVNLLSSDINQPENALSRRFYRHIQMLSKTPAGSSIHYVPFDMNSVLGGVAYDSLAAILSSVITVNFIENIGLFIFDKNRSAILSTQKGVFRINCLDCLDRTNVIQSLISQSVLKHILLQVGGGSILSTVSSTSSFSSKFNCAWADNGDALSFLYTGTGALKSGFTRTGKRTLYGIVDDLKKSTQRFYVNTFQDKYRQKLIDYILGKGPSKIHLFSDKAALNIDSPFTECRDSHFEDEMPLCAPKFNLLIYCCTYNIGGELPEHINFGMLLRPLWKACNDQAPDMFVISLQEAVELSPHQVLTSDDTSLASMWESHIEKYLTGFFPKTKYIFLSSIQMVGLVMILIISKPLLPQIRKVERFTGFGGVTGNKGSIGLRFELEIGTSFCFINSHFSSGHDNVTLRNREYYSVFNDTVFPSGLSIDCHSYGSVFYASNIIWMGDLNYRIDVPLDAFKMDNISTEWLLSLLPNDQLLKEKQSGAIFDDFKEGAISFPPTYKFSSNANTLAKPLDLESPGGQIEFYFKPKKWYSVSCYLCTRT
ncbi:hypothetical protein DI09_9p170 [Mitosporidium daphniae]|uniref:phosphoinositide 5-phosphatase n=1 Tax=Mitosporidium daphniae TaxID=1485682 RepID=A0A098VMD3_9MICR|nr:uncharacterized protein DI09_9p170 [Mitosporidium daphniae]KGG49934.1 hypothetical protein DI09_9p170 [Mitosporidium daphniae]|eukprot:XP_013236361.1 uncharacterized protein DI09_9p170 [Mitosporidium daphniae]